MNKLRICTIFILAGLLTSCGKGTSAETTTSDTTTIDTTTPELTSESITDSLPDDLDFAGDTVRIGCRNQEFSLLELTAEQNGEIVADAVYNRNLNVEERLNISLDVVPVADAPQDVAKLIEASVLAGSDDYDIVAGTQWAVLPQSLDGMYRDISDAKYLDLSKPWWWSSYIDAVRIGNEKTFFVEGDLCLLSIQHMSCIFFNKNMAWDMGIDPDALYQTVLDGEWTYALLSEYSEMAYNDVDGDGIADEDDIFGFMARTETETNHFTYTAGNVMSIRDENGLPSLNINNEHFADYMDMLYTLYYNNTGVYITSDENLMRTRFAEDGTFFLINRFISCNYLRDMESDYGIIPMPKYDESQQEYGALVHDSATIYCVPVTVSERYDIVGATLEAMCAESYRAVVPTYFEMALKTKYASDSTTGLVVDIIKEAATTDFAYAYNYALNNAGLLCRTVIGNASGNTFASAWAKIESGADNGLNELINLYMNLE